MEMLEGILKAVTDYVLPHWPFIMMAAILALVGQWMKKLILTEARVEKSRFWLAMQNTMAWHPVLAGALLGLVPGLPVSAGVADTWAAHSLYFAGAGMASTWLYSGAKAAKAIVRQLLKKKLGVELPAESVPPGAQEDTPTTPGKPASKPPDDKPAG